MATEAGNYSINLRGIEASEIMLVPVFVEDDIQNYFEIMPDVRRKAKMMFAGELPPAIRRYVGCDFNPTQGMTISEREIETEEGQVNLQICMADFKGTNLNQLANRGAQKQDARGTVFARILNERLLQANKKQLWSLAFFGDKSSANPEINLCDGLFTTYFPEIIAGGNASYIPIDQSTPLVLGEAIELLDKVYYERPKALKGMPKSDQIYFVSSAVYEQLEQDARQGLVGSDIYVINLQDGTSMTTYQGIEVKEMLDWEYQYSQYVDSSVENAQLVVLTSRQNMIFATDVMADINNMNIYYDNHINVTKFSSAFELGFNYVHENLFSLAY